jgi:hypothetical protein
MPGTLLPTSRLTAVACGSSSCAALRSARRCAASAAGGVGDEVACPT